MQQNLGVKVAPPRNRNSIRKDAFKLRQQLKLNKCQYVDIVGVLEFVLPVVDPLFHLAPVIDKELLGRYAETRPAEHAIYVKQSVYDAAVRGGGWARMILAHEFGHYCYHDTASVAYAYMDRNERLNPDVDPERQADIFAAEFLAPSGELKGMTVKQVQDTYGVSTIAARNQLRQANNIVRRHEKKKKRRSGKKPDR